MISNKHVSVLLTESIENLNINPDGIYVDMTLGRAGHSSLILSKLSSKGRLIAFDKDITAINESEKILSKVSNNFTLIHSDFRSFKEKLTALGVNSVDGILFDLGVSSPQLDNIERGFSYKGDAPLDMRMDESQSFSAYDVVNTYSIGELIRVFRDYGEEKFAKSIAHNIVKARSNSPIRTTSELTEIIKASKPAKELAKKGHPAKQVYQAIRIEVNDELGALKEALNDALRMLNVGGRIVVISFHSLEDRIVKIAFKNASSFKGNRLNDWKLPTPEDEPDYQLVGKMILPSEIEMEENPRSKSAKMRVISKIK